MADSDTWVGVAWQFGARFVSSSSSAPVTVFLGCTLRYRAPPGTPSGQLPSVFGSALTRHASRLAPRVASISPTRVAAMSRFAPGAVKGTREPAPALRCALYVSVSGFDILFCGRSTLFRATRGLVGFCMFDISAVRSSHPRNAIASERTDP